jgi:hypothetical protein
MNHYKLSLSILLAAATLYWGPAPSYANDTANPEQGTAANQAQSGQGRKKMPHDARKAAATRLKARHDTARADELARQVQEQGHGNHAGHLVGEAK